MGGIVRESKLLTDATGGSGSAVNIADGVAGTLATVFGLLNSNPIATQLVGTTGNPITTFGGSVSNTSAVTTVAATTVSVALLTTNANRLMASVYNDATGILYAALGTTASTTAYTVQIGPGMYYELPVPFLGAINGIWSTIGGSGAKVTELT